MQAFLVETAKGDRLFYCSMTCATKHNFGIPDGAWLMQDEYDDSEFCANCEIFLDDQRRAASVLMGRGVPCGQRERDAKILAESNIELLNALTAALPNLEWANIHGSRCEEILTQVKTAIRKAE